MKQKLDNGESNQEGDLRAALRSRFALSIVFENFSSCSFAAAAPSNCQRCSSSTRIALDITSPWEPRPPPPPPSRLTSSSGTSDAARITVAADRVTKAALELSMRQDEWRLSCSISTAASAVRMQRVEISARRAASAREGRGLGVDGLSVWRAAAKTLGRSKTRRMCRILIRKGDQNNFYSSSVLLAKGENKMMRGSFEKDQVGSDYATSLYLVITAMAWSLNISSRLLQG